MTPSSAPFALDPQLAADACTVGDLTLSRVLLMKHARYPWLILVPRRAGVREILDLADAEQACLFGEITQASRVVQTLFRPDKLNIGAIGNMVAQLHVHVVGRFKTDEAWPRPVWGAGSPTPYGAAELEERLAMLSRAFGRI
ncbi:HIT domain-containing protein [Alsobacter sp. KACC 23698]|uniref:HIT domain-containing protein n=1 Tax=Alsobacter sp. KACC 23698 TaxID=3149229 RepID=A0AAU7JH19_9HYPH